MPSTNFLRGLSRIRIGTCAVVILLACVGMAHAQQTTGNVRGVIKDATGALIAGAAVSIVEKNTNERYSTVSTSTGDFEFKNLPVGAYTVTIAAGGFKNLKVDDVLVQLNQTTDLSPTVEVGNVSESVTVSAGGSELIDTTTSTLAKGFDSKEVEELPQTSGNTVASGISGVYNLALLAPNVVTSGGVGVGVGGSVGGQRSRNNDFVIDGVDDNNKSITGPEVYVSPEAVAEFSLMSNYYPAEFAHSTGGQFIIATKAGTNGFHGTAYGFFENRHLDALNTLLKQEGVTRETSPTNPNPNPRFDAGRFGGSFGGPIIKDKLFFFGMFERQQLGAAAGAGGVLTPTAAGFSELSSIPGLSPTNLAIFKQYVPVATAANGQTITVGGQNIPVGTVNIPSPNFVNNDNYELNIDFAQSEKTHHTGRFILNDGASIDTAASIPAFFQLRPVTSRLFSYTLEHTFTPTLIDETRLSYRRYVSNTPAGNFSYPGLDVFPTIQLLDLNGITIGPDGNAPQSTIENNYQFSNTVSYIRGSHSFKAGIDVRKLIAPEVFIQRARGNYVYNSTDLFLEDLSPDNLAQRSVGLSPYEGNQALLFAFVQDDWRIKSNFTVNLGLNYAYQEVPFTARQQTLNSLASVPGVIEFNQPTSQKTNFGPRVGLAYSPNFDSGPLHWLFGSNNASSIRAGFSMAYDVVFDNLYLDSLTPEFSEVLTVTPGLNTPNFLADGGIKPAFTQLTNAAVARADTSAYTANQQVPYAITRTLSFQREVAKNWGLELRYLGTNGVHLVTQDHINVQSEVSATRSIPTFLTQPSVGDLKGLPTASQLFTCFPGASPCDIIPSYLNAGFSTPITAFLFNGYSTYNAFSAQLTHRLSNGLTGTAAYTWSHLIDNSTAEVDSTALTPRRQQDFQDLAGDKATSSLSRTNRFVIGLIYDLPFFKENRAFVRSLAGGWTVSGTYTLESGEWATPQSGVDSNLNGDAAGDRAILNAGGIPGTGSAVVGVNSDGQQVPLNSPAATLKTIVAYVATNPKAQYIQAGPGAFATAGRNTLQLPGINDFDFSVFKNFRVRESTALQFRVDMFNAFNHPQWTPGVLDGVGPTSTASANGLVDVANSSFNQPNTIFGSNPRVVQMSLRFSF
jgi:hypothetical protein